VVVRAFKTKGFMRGFPACSAFIHNVRESERESESESESESERERERARERRRCYRVNIQTRGGIEIDTILHHFGRIEKFLSIQKNKKIKKK
jgi:hypothetical protein